MPAAPESFGRRLTSQRERRGVPLETIAASTKIRMSLLADLERDDVSKWPHGIFRRAFVREYAKKIGLAPETVVAEFLTLFPDDAALRGPVTTDFELASDLRLTLAESDDLALHARIVQVLVAALETCALVATARVLTWATGSGFWMLCAAIALTYYPAAAASCGSTPALWWLQRRRAHRAGRADQPAASGLGDLLQLLVQQARARRADVQQGAMVDRRRRTGKPSDRLKVS